MKKKDLRGQKEWRDESEEEQERRQRRNDTTYMKGERQTVLKKSELHGASFSQARSRALAVRNEKGAVCVTQTEAVTSRSPAHVIPSRTPESAATGEPPASLAPNLM